MKKTLIISSAIIFLLLAFLVSVPFWVDANKYKNNITSLIKEKTGRDINIAGDITLSILPNISLTLNNVSLASSFKDEANLFKAQKFILKVKLMPLFHKRLEVDSFKLEEPEFSLHVTPDGKQNWAEEKITHLDEDKPLVKSPAPEKNNKISDAGVEGGSDDILEEELAKGEDINNPDDGHIEPERSLNNFVFNSIKIINGKVTFKDDKTKQNINISDINLDTSLKPGANRFDLSLKLNNLKDADKGKLSAKGQYYVSDNQYGIENVAILFDKTEAHLNLVYDLGLYKPALKLALYMGSVNLNDYIQAEAAKKSPSGDDDAGEKPFTWSDTPIDFSVIRSLDLNLNVKTSGITYKDIVTNDIMFNAYIRNNRLNANIKDSKLYGGIINGEVSVDSTVDSQTLKGNFKIDHLDLGTMPKKSERINPASGIVNADVKFRAIGNSQKTIVNNLNGTAKFNADNVELEGIDIFSMANNLSSAFDIGHANNKTKIKEASADFDIKQGVMSNSNAVLKSDIMNFSGAGDIDLGNLTINYTLTPKLANENPDKPTTNIPVVITGSLFSPSFKLAVKSLVQDLIKNPQGADNLVKQLKNDLKDAKNNIKNGSGTEVIKNLQDIFKPKTNP